jgi:predicted nucleotidyltransferase component of viral defense system
MQELKALLERERHAARVPTVQDLLNMAREYLQVIMLKTIYGGKQGRSLSFVGGTYLRICRDLKRYSEDLNFNLDVTSSPYDFTSLTEEIQREFKLRGITCERTADTARTVNQSFLRFPGLPHALGLSRNRTEKMHIKLEVDTNPPRRANDQRASVFVTKFNELFPIIAHRDETLFAGKLVALLSRPYAKGRDYYDLIWYLREGTDVDLAYFNAGMRQTASIRGEKRPAAIKSEKALFEKLKLVVVRAEPDALLKDVARFLEDPSEMSWIKQYRKVFEQLVTKRLSG